MDVRHPHLDHPISAPPVLWGLTQSAGDPACVTAAGNGGRWTFCGRRVREPGDHPWMPGEPHVILGRSGPLPPQMALCEECALVAAEIARLCLGPALPPGWTPKP